MDDQGSIVHRMNLIVLGFFTSRFRLRFALGIATLFGFRVPLFIPIFKAFGQFRVLLETASSLHELGIGVFLCKGSLAQEFDHVVAVEDLFLQKPLSNFYNVLKRSKCNISVK